MRVQSQSMLRNKTITKNKSKEKRFAAFLQYGGRDKSETSEF
jgi:hypothetical protein